MPSLDKKQPSPNAQQLAETTAQAILSGFESHYQSFKKIAAEAKIHFENANWQQILIDSQNRLYAYSKRVKACTEQLNVLLDTASFNEHLWTQTKNCYINLISRHHQPELAETFYNSVFCRLFDKNFYNNNFIFVRPSIAVDYIDIDAPVVRSYYVSQTKGQQLSTIVQQVLLDCQFKTNYENSSRDSIRLTTELIKQSPALAEQSVEIQMLKMPFFRAQNAFLIGRIIYDGVVKPFLIALSHNKNKGIFVDAMLTNVSEISVVFSFSRAYFLVNTDYPNAVVVFLQRILTNKTKADLYSAIGLHKHGKNLLYRMYLKYTKVSSEKLVIAPGIKGMVMSVFGSPTFPYVFKVINDKFASPKTASRKEVREKYYFVKNHIKVGRLADTWEFSNVAFPLANIDADLLLELKNKISRSLEIKDDLLIIKHLYMENKMTPLNIFLDNCQSEAVLTAIIKDYGDAIDELINANVFPGDMLTKNFGVTRQNRIVFYDYDEITAMDKPKFRKIPISAHIQDEMSAEPWYHVGENDVFPEEFAYFMFTKAKMKAIFIKEHQRLLDASYWQGVQKNIKKGNIKDACPYQEKHRMVNLYPKTN